MTSSTIHTDKFLVSVSDIRDKYFEGKTLSKDELLALSNFDRYRVVELEKVKESSFFDQRYFELQVLENLHPYELFLDFENISALINKKAGFK